MIRTTKKQRKETAALLKKGESVEIQGIAELKYQNVSLKHKRTGKVMKAKRMVAKALKSFNELR